MTADPLSQLDVSRETLERLSVYEKLLERWNPRINLVAPKSLPDIRIRHFADSAQLFRLTRKTGRWLDLGSGAGFPGLVLAALAAERSPAVHVTLVESDQRKAAFLNAAAAAMTLTVTVIADRIETISPQAADLVTARALAPLDLLLPMVEKHRKPGGVALFLKGETVHTELARASRLWHFEHTLHPSLTEPRAAIVEIGAIARV